MVLAQALSGGVGGGPLVPAWFVVPIALLTLLVVAAHVVLVDRSDMPPSRKRLRTVNGVLMMFTIPVAAYACGFASPERPRVFVALWMIVFGLVTLVLLLAIADIMNTWLMNWRERRELQDQIAATRAALKSIQSRE